MNLKNIYRCFLLIVWGAVLTQCGEDTSHSRSSKSLDKNNTESKSEETLDSSDELALQPARITEYRINDGKIQRSALHSVRIKFNRQVEPEDINGEFYNVDTEDEYSFEIAQSDQGSLLLSTNYREMKNGKYVINLRVSNGGTIGAGLLASKRSVSLDDKDLFKLEGDFNGDGYVSSEDKQMLEDAVGSDDFEAVFYMDLDLDGKLDAGDVTVHQAIIDSYTSSPKTCSISGPPIYPELGLAIPHNIGDPGITSDMLHSKKHWEQSLDRFNRFLKFEPELMTHLSENFMYSYFFVYDPAVVDAGLSDEQFCNRYGAQLEREEDEEEVIDLYLAGYGDGAKRLGQLYFHRKLVPSGTGFKYAGTYNTIRRCDYHCKTCGSHLPNSNGLKGLLDLVPKYAGKKDKTFNIHKCRNPLKVTVEIPTSIAPTVNGFSNINTFGSPYNSGCRMYEHVNSEATPLFAEHVHTQVLEGEQCDFYVEGAVFGIDHLFKIEAAESPNCTLDEAEVSRRLGWAGNGWRDFSKSHLAITLLGGTDRLGLDLPIDMVTGSRVNADDFPLLESDLTYDWQTKEEIFQPVSRQQYGQELGKFYEYDEDEVREFDIPFTRLSGQTFEFKVKVQRLP